MPFRESSLQPHQSRRRPGRLPLSLLQRGRSSSRGSRRERESLFDRPEHHWTPSRRSGLPSRPYRDAVSQRLQAHGTPCTLFAKPSFHHLREGPGQPSRKPSSPLRSSQTSTSQFSQNSISYESPSC